MGIKEDAIAEMDALMRDYGIPPSRIGRELFNNPSFYALLKMPETKVTNVSLDKIFKYAVEFRGQNELPLTEVKNERSKE